MAPTGTNAFVVIPDTDPMEVVDLSSDDIDLDMRKRDAAPVHRTKDVQPMQKLATLQPNRTLPVLGTLGGARVQNSCTIYKMACAWYNNDRTR